MLNKLELLKKDNALMHLLSSLPYEFQLLNNVMSSLKYWIGTLEKKSTVWAPSPPPLPKLPSKASIAKLFEAERESGREQ